MFAEPGEFFCKRSFEMGQITTKVFLGLKEPRKFTQSTIDILHQNVIFPKLFKVLRDIINWKKPKHCE